MHVLVCCVIVQTLNNEAENKCVLFNIAQLFSEIALL